MNLLSIILGLSKAWGSVPASEKTAIIDAFDGLLEMFAAHRKAMAPVQPPQETPAKPEWPAGFSGPASSPK